MFGGWFALIATSVLIYRIAAANNRRRFLWVGMLWAFVFGTGIATAVITALILHFSGVSYATEQQVTQALVIPTAIGMLVGAIICVWLASRSMTPDIPTDPDRSLAPARPPTALAPLEPPPIPLESIPHRI
jgi:hypothetical protein